ncbi:MAG: DnaD domain protein [Bacilli bacterium]|jgi:DNA replication protein|nr:DnaD domain protein [Bacilli bacterium]
MSQNYNLIKSGVIDFNNILIEKYAFIGLNEQEVVTLIKLQNILKQPTQDNVTSLVVDKLPKIMSEAMSISSDEISDLLAKLIENKYIDILESNGDIIYSLDPIYKRLANIIDNDEAVNEELDSINLVKKIVGIVEKEFGILISPLDLEIIKAWVNDYKYSFDEMNDAILDALKKKRKSVKVVNDILKAKRIAYMNETKQKKDDNIEALFNDIYGKIKS